MAQMTLEEKKTYFALACRVAGINIDQPKLMDLLVELYDKMLEKSGNLDLPEIKKISDSYLKPEAPKDEAPKEQAPEPKRRIIPRKK